MKKVVLSLLAACVSLAASAQFTNTNPDIENTNTGTVRIRSSLLMGLSYGSSNNNLEWLSSSWAAGYGHKLYNLDPGDGTGTVHLRIASRGGVSTWTDMVNFASSGRVGVGTNNPQALMHLSSTPFNTVPYLRIGHSTNADGFTGEAGGIRFFKHFDHFETVKIYLYTDWNAYGGANYQSSDLRFATAPRGGNGLQDRMVITGDGKVGIGTNDPKGYLLAVAGGVAAESVKVKLQSTWPDFVFTPAYYLRPLVEVERHIKEQGHLPEVPSAAEVAKEGLDVASTDAMLLKKIEELTLYLIEQNKQLSKQNGLIESLTQENKDLQSRVQQLETR